MLKLGILAVFIFILILCWTCIHYSIDILPSLSSLSHTKMMDVMAMLQP